MRLCLPEQSFEMMQPIFARDVVTTVPRGELRKEIVMKKTQIIAAFATGLSAFALTACDVEQTEEAELPDVDVQGGQMPEYDADVADVEIGTEEKTVEVPTIDVDEADASQPEANQ
jgi:hypothetical protein